MMVTISPYLNFQGNTEEAFNFYKSVFGGEFLSLQRYKDTPAAEHTDPKDLEKIMHVSLPVGGNVLMGTDALDNMPLTLGNNMHLALAANSEKEAHNIFNGLSSGGKITMKLEKTFWGALFGMFTDKFGISWMVNYDYPPSE